MRGHLDDSPVRDAEKHPEKGWLCRWCGEPCPGRRRSYCCDEHIALCLPWLAYDPRGIVWDRDKGICALCGADTRELRRLQRRYQDYGRHGHKFKAFRKWMLDQGYGWPQADGHQALWEADHIVSTAEGGPHTLVNLRTLCVPCHKRETAALAGRRAAARQKQIPLLTVPRMR